MLKSGQDGQEFRGEATGKVVHMHKFKGGSGAEKRQFGRRQTHLHAWVSLPGRERLRCLVQDLSIGGALLKFDAPPTGVPFCFKLTIEATRFVTACETRHARDNWMGVEFVPMDRLIEPTKRCAADTAEDWGGIGDGYAGAGAGRNADGGRRG